MTLPKDMLNSYPLPWTGQGGAYLIDTTLRDGEQAPGVIFSLAEKLEIANLLDKIGIEELEIGSPFISERDVFDIRKIVTAGYHFRSSCWARARYSDIDAAALTGASAVNISFPVSDIQLAALDKERNWVMNTVPELVEYAKKRFKYVSLGAQDASRAQPDFLNGYVKLADSIGVYRVRIADTVGNMNPASVFNLIGNLKASLKTSKLQLEFHGHNDLGMANANTLCALQAGANCASVTVNGLGERAGNAALEEVIMALKYSLGVPMPYHISKFQEVSSLVAEASGRPIHSAKPITGDMSHKHESGIHTNSIIQNAQTYELYSAKEIGKVGSEFVFGTHSGSASIKHFFQTKSVSISKDEASIVLNKVKGLSAKLKRNLSEIEIEALYNSLKAKPGIFTRKNFPQLQKMG